MKKYHDHYHQRAKRENYPARSVYKLKEMNKRFQLLKKGQKVLDLGAAPGSWTLYAAQQSGPTGRVLAVDLSELGAPVPDNVLFYQDDVFEPSDELQQALEEHGPFDLVISDMAPKTTGVKFADQARSFDLAMQALALARARLVKEGHFVVKIFEGPDTPELQRAMRAEFKRLKPFKPKSSRSESKETFLVGLGKK
ncbi:MAG: RlmE family RNA methyltransferase [Desulfovibrionales bacterium]